MLHRIQHPLQFFGMDQAIDGRIRRIGWLPAKRLGRPPRSAPVKSQMNCCTKSVCSSVPGVSKSLGTSQLEEKLLKQIFSDAGAQCQPREQPMQLRAVLVQKRQQA